MQVFTRLRACVKGEISWNEALFTLLISMALVFIVLDVYCVDAIMLSHCIDVHVISMVLTAMVLIYMFIM